MLSSVLKSKTAIEMNIAIMRAFVQMRKVCRAVGASVVENSPQSQKKIFAPIPTPQSPIPNRGAIKAARRFEGAGSYHRK